MSPVFRVHNGSGHVSSIVTKVGKFSEEIGIVGDRGEPSWKGMSSSGLKFEEQVSVKEIVIFLLMSFEWRLREKNAISIYFFKRSIYFFRFYVEYFVKIVLFDDWG